MSHSDIIIEVLSEEAPLTASKLYEKLKEKGFQKSHRTLQRHLAEMVKEGLIESKAIGREIVYLLSNSKGKTPPNHFLAKYWNEIFEIERKLATDSWREVNDARAKLRVLVVLLPKEIKKEILPLIKNMDKRFGINPNPFKISVGVVMKLREEIISILDKLADLLHSYAKEGVKHE
jgi:Fe2+ or Zn2+ uptake regulation protein